MHIATILPLGQAMQECEIRPIACAAVRVAHTAACVVCRNAAAATKAGRPLEGFVFGRARANAPRRGAHSAPAHSSISLLGEDQSCYQLSGSRTYALGQSNNLASQM